MTDEIHIQTWIKCGSMRVRADALDSWHPDYIYNQAARQVPRPEEYGIFHPLQGEIDRTMEQIYPPTVNLDGNDPHWYYRRVMFRNMVESARLEHLRIYNE